MWKFTKLWHTSINEENKHKYLQNSWTEMAKHWHFYFPLITAEYTEIKWLFWSKVKTLARPTQPRGCSALLHSFSRTQIIHLIERNYSFFDLSVCSEVKSILGRISVRESRNKRKEQKSFTTIITTLIELNNLKFSHQYASNL